MEADLIVLNTKSTPLIEFRMKHCESLEDALFVQMTMGDERAIDACYIAGQRHRSQ
jgi:guanine deaminase